MTRRMIATAVPLLVIALASPAGASRRDPVVTRKVVRAPITIDISKASGQPAAEPAPQSFSVSTRGCTRFRFVGRWRLVSTSGVVHSYPEVEATIAASANRLASIRWSDRGSGLGAVLSEPKPGSVVRVRSPWFTRVTNDPAAVTLTTHAVLDRGTDTFADRWSVERLDLECRRST